MISPSPLSENLPPESLLFLLRFFFPVQYEEQLRRIQEALARLEALQLDELVRDWEQLRQDCPDFQVALTALIQWLSNEIQG